MQVQFQHTIEITDQSPWARPPGVWVLKGLVHGLGLALLAGAVPLLYRDWFMPFHSRMTLLGAVGLVLAVLGLATLVLISLPVRFAPRDRKLLHTIVAAVVLGAAVYLAAEAGRLEHPSPAGMLPVLYAVLPATWASTRLGMLWWMPGLQTSSVELELWPERDG